MAFIVTTDDDSIIPDTTQPTTAPKSKTWRLTRDADGAITHHDDPPPDPHALTRAVAALARAATPQPDTHNDDRITALENALAQINNKLDTIVALVARN